MSISITVTDLSIDEAIVICGKIAEITKKPSTVGVVKDQNNADNTKPAPAAPKAPAAKPKSAPSKSKAKPAEAAKPAGDSRESLNAALCQVYNDKGMETCVEILGKYGASRVSEVKDEDITACIADLEAVSGGAF